MIQQKMFAKTGFIGEDIFVIYGTSKDAVTLVLSHNGYDSVIEDISLEKAKKIVERLEIKALKKSLDKI